MSLFDTIKNLTKPFDDDDDFFDDEDASTRIPVGEKVKDPAAAAPAEKEKEKKTSFFSDPGPDYEPAPPRSAFASRRELKAESKVVNIGATQQKVVLVSPERFEAAADIADHLREKHTVVMNLEMTNKDIARRLIDFLSGVTYAQDGKIKKVSNSTYLITPYNVDLSGGDGGDVIETNGLYF